MGPDHPGVGSAGNGSKSGSRERGKIIHEGTQYSRLTVTGTRILHKPHWYYLCQCSCGTSLEVMGSLLRSGGVKSCGCLGLDRNLEPGQSGFAMLVREYRKSARKKDIPFTLDATDLATLFQGPCHYCGAAPSRIKKTQNDHGHYTYNGLDRVNNALGYERGNVVAACWTCNQAKGTQSVDAFLPWAMKIHHPTWTPVEHITPTSAEESVYRSYQEDARRRGVEFLLGSNIMTAYFRAPCAYCGKPPSQGKKRLAYRYTGVDRVDNEVGYEGGNTVAACKACNYAKRDLSLAEFLAWAARLQAYQASLA